jgi:hypothetical protein
MAAGVVAALALLALASRDAAALSTPSGSPSPIVWGKITRSSPAKRGRGTAEGGGGGAGQAPISSDVALAADEGTLLDGRIRDSYAAAQALQGPLDGAWSLCGLDGRPLYDFEIVDPPGPRPRIEAAWRAPMGSDGESGVADVSALGRTSIQIEFKPAAGPARIALRLGRHGDWTGVLVQGAERVGVLLARDRC